MTDGKGAYGSNTSIFDRTGSCLPKIACIPQPYMCRPPACACGGIMYLGHTIWAAGSLLLLTRRPLIAPETRPLFLSWMATMQLTQLNRECLLHLFSFLDKDSRRSLSLTCHRLHEVFLDSRLWNLLHFSSPCELKRDNFVLGPSLHYLTVCWHSSRVLQVCNIEDWLKSSFQKDICSKHESLVSAFLARVCHMCPNLLSLTLSGCGHITDLDVISVLQSCRRLRSLHLENCVRITDCSLQGVAAHGHSLEKLTVDFCRNITQAGLQAIRDRRPGIQLSSERSADMIPDSKPEERMPLRRTLPKHLLFS